MRRVLPTVIVWILGTLFVAAHAHDDHDFVPPSGDWPIHLHQHFVNGRGATPVEATVWKLADGTTGSSSNSQWDDNINDVIADVNTVAYNDEFVYLRTTGIPSHSIGNETSPAPAIPGDIDATYRVFRNPVPATNNRATGLGAIGVAVNGSAIFNWSDASYWDPSTNQLVNAMQGQLGDWNTNALWRRMASFDSAGGHPAGGQGPLNAATYHYHQDPFGLEEQIDPGNTGQRHSPIVGFAFDGYPIYGPYGYANGTDASQGFHQMTSSYQLISSRPAGGPSEQDYALGSFKEDFVYVAGAGTLNEFNMAFVVTPEYPNGKWAYFTTYDVDGGGTPLDGDLAYPFTVGPEYFGEVDTEMVMPNSNITVPNNVTFVFDYVPLYTPDSIEVTRGILASGTASDLAASDDADLSIFRSNVDVQSRTEFVCKSTSAESSPTLLHFTLEASVFARTQVNQTIEFFNYDTGNWAEIDTRAASRFSDATVTVQGAGNLARFVDDATGCIEVRVRFQSLNPRQRFSSNIDQAVWGIE